MRELVSRAIDTTIATHQQPPEEFRTFPRRVPLDIHTQVTDPYNVLGKPDVLLHFAWSGLPRYDSSHHIEEELPAHASFLSACVRSGIRRVMVAGTCFEYGLTSGEISEDRALDPVTLYGQAKARLFQYMTSLRETASFELVWPRLFYLYGPGQSRNSLYSLLQAAIARGEESFDMSGGEQVRDYLPIAEAARLLVDVAFSSGDIGAINICSGKPTRLKDLVARWIAEAGSTTRMNLGRLPYSSFEPMAFWGSRTKVDRLLGGP